MKRILLWVFIAVFPDAFPQSNIDSLLSLLAKDKEDTTKANRFYDLGFAYKEVGSLDTAFTYANLAHELSLKLNFKKGIGNAFGLMGTVHYFRADYPKALDCYLKALKIDEALNNKKGIAVRMGNLGNVYYTQGEYQKSIDHYLKALQIEEALGNKTHIAAWLGNIGIVYSMLNNYQAAIETYSKALKISEELGDKNGYARNLSNMGIVYDKQKNYPRALEYYGKALKISEEVGDKIGITRNLANIGSLYTLTGNFKAAEKNLKRAADMANTIGAMNDLRQVQEWLSQLYDTTGQYKLALQFYKRSIVLKDTIYSQENKKEVIRKELNFAFEKKEAVAKAEQDKKDALSRADLKRQKILSYSVIGGLLLVLVVAIVIFRALRVTRKQKSIIFEQKKIVDKKNEHITDSITYALTIQESILPKAGVFERLFRDSFVLFLPKDIVSGDFYWIKELPNEILISVIDCTGHGVPGAFMSVHAYNHLERVVTEHGVTSPAAILDELNSAIITTMGAKDDVGSVKNGMDMALAKLNPKTYELEFSGAKNSLLIVRGNETIKLKADNMPVGNLTGSKFSMKTEKLQQGDMIYLFTDGYKDQNGGSENKRFYIATFEELLREIAQDDCARQKDLLLNRLRAWKGNLEQIDDICVVGIRV